MIAQTPPAIHARATPAPIPTALPDNVREPDYDAYLAEATQADADRTCLAHHLGIGLRGRGRVTGTVHHGVPDSLITTTTIRCASGALVQVWRRVR